MALGRQYVYCNVEKFVRMKTKTQAGSLGIYNSAAKTDTPFLQTALAGAAKVNKFYRYIYSLCDWLQCSQRFCEGLSHNLAVYFTPVYINKHCPPEKLF